MKVTKLQIEDISIKDIDKMLLESDYVSNNEISTTLYLSFLLGKPMLIEGPPGVGKTELAKVIAKSFDRDFFRIQCYEGITFEQIVGEWNYQKQLLHLEAAKNDSNNVDEIFDDEFFIRRSLLNAFLNDNDSVLLIDEIDKADEEVESFLLQALGEQEITINDLGTFQLNNDLIVILTSNSQRSLLDETKDRCLFLYIPYPTVEREIEIVKSKIPGADDDTVSHVVKIVHRIRDLNLMKKPSVRGTVDWVKSVSNLGTRDIDQTMEDTIGVAIKTESDRKRVVKDIFNKAGIPVEGNLKDGISRIDNATWLKDLLQAFKFIIQMRNSKVNSDVDYLLSPALDNNGKIFDSRFNDASMPNNADANGAYNIARKGLMLVHQIMESLDLDNLKYDLSNKAWLQFAQNFKWKN